MKKVLTYLSTAAIFWPGAVLAQVNEFDTGSTPDDAAAAAVGAGLLGASFAVLAFFVILGIISFIIWIWALIDVIRRQFTNPSDKTLWLIVVIILGVIGAIVYLIAGRSKGTIAGQAATPSTPPQK